MAPGVVREQALKSSPERDTFGTLPGHFGANYVALSSRGDPFGTIASHRSQTHGPIPSTIEKDGAPATQPL